MYALEKGYSQAVVRTKIVPKDPNVKGVNKNQGVIEERMLKMPMRKCSEMRHGKEIQIPAMLVLCAFVLFS